LLSKTSQIARKSHGVFKAIEHDDFSSLLGRVYFLGYTRAIARAVSLDEESVLAALREKMQIAWID
jgi:cytoskeletal protein RodZ